MDPLPEISVSVNSIPQGYTHWMMYQSTQSPREHTLNDVSVNSIPPGYTHWMMYQSTQSPREHTLNDVSVNSISQGTHTEWCMGQLNLPGNTHWMMYQSTQSPRVHTLNDVSVNSIPREHTEWWAQDCHIWTLNVNLTLRNGKFAVVLKIFSDNDTVFCLNSNGHG